MPELDRPRPGQSCQEAAAVLTEQHPAPRPQLPDLAAHLLPELPAALEAAAEEPGARRSPKTPPLFLGGTNQQGWPLLTETALPLKGAGARCLDSMRQRRQSAAK